MGRAFAIVFLLILLAVVPVAVFVVLTTSCTNAPTVRLSEAWSCWLSGQEVKHLSLTGLLVPDGFSILFWGRLGKVLSFLSALYIVAEIIGYEKISGFLKDLREAAPNLAERVRWIERGVGPPFGLLGALLAVAWATGVDERVFGRTEVGIWVNAIAGILLVVLASGLAVDLLFRGILKLVEKDFLWTKILVLLMLTLGFHFDLLAS